MALEDWGWGGESNDAELIMCEGYLHRAEGTRLSIRRWPEGW